MTYPKWCIVQRSVGNKEFWNFVKQNKHRRIAFVYNHNTDGYFSETDMHTLLSNSNMYAMIAVRNDAVIYVAEKKGNGVPANVLFDLLYETDLNILQQKFKEGIIEPYERAMEREKIIVDGLLRDYTKAGGEIDGRK